MDVLEIVADAQRQPVLRKRRQPDIVVINLVVAKSLDAIGGKSRMKAGRAGQRFL